MTKFLTRVFRFIGSSIKPNGGGRRGEKPIPIAIFFLRIGGGESPWQGEEGRSSCICVNKKGYSFVSLSALGVCKADPSRKIPFLLT